MSALARVNSPMSKMRKRKTLEEWIQEAMSDPEKGEAISHIALMHMSGITSHEEIYTIHFGNGPKTATEISDIFQDKAESFSQDASGTQTFCLFAFYGSSREPQAKHPFVVSPMSDGSLMTEPPTQVGQTMQGMRHNEIIMQAVFRKDAMLFDKFERLLEIQNGMLSQAMTERKDLIELTTKLILDKATNDHNFRMEELKFERSSGERKKWLGMLPSIINSAFGKEIIPQSTADTALLETIAENLDEEQLKKLADILPSEVVGIVFGRMEDVLKRKRLKKAEARALLKDVDPEADAGGD